MGGRVLVLNATFEPINVCTVRRAAVLVLKEKAVLLERAELQDSRSKMLARLVADRVTQDRADHDERHQSHDVEVALTRQEPTQQHCGFARKNEPDEERRLYVGRPGSNCGSVTGISRSRLRHTRSIV